VKFADIFGGVPSELPPLREINHRIPLMDNGKQYNYHLLRCPDAMKPQVMEKLQLYVDSGWWVPKAVPQAAPLLCIPKKTGKLRTVVDCWQCNDNMVKDVTPFPDQDQIRMDVAQAKYHSKIDLSNAYKQVRIKPNDVHKTAFATVFGTCKSNVMQQGDCNAPATFQQLMTAIFRNAIGQFAHIYIDDLFVYDNTVEDHAGHLEYSLQKLRENHLFLEEVKCDLFLSHMDCLGHLIDDRGLHADTDKMACVRNWPGPKNLKDVQQFLGLIQYLAHFMPDITAYTGLLTAICRNGQPFYWKPLHETCFNHIKSVACKTPILKPIVPSSNQPIWIICDTSMSGISSMDRQGETWQTCRPTGFMSKKFSSAQMNYQVFKMETIAILKALLKWEDKLLGRKITVVTDHKALEFFKMQRRLNSRQVHWMEFLARFDYDIMYVKGETNLVADTLSRYYESNNWDEMKDTPQYVNADARLDPEGEDLPWDRFKETREMRETGKEHNTCMQWQRQAPQQADEPVSFTPKRPVVKAIEERQQEAAELVAHKESTHEQPSDEHTVHVLRSNDQVDPMIRESLGQLPNLHPRVEGNRSILKDIKNGYPKDLLLSKVLENVAHHKSFEIIKDLIYTQNRAGDSVLCIPSIIQKKRRLTEVIIAQAHEVLGHFGPQKTAEYIRCHYWWPRIGHDVKLYCKTCPICQMTKTSNQ